MNPGEPLACPVCKARFRGERECPRCSADLTPLMLLAAHAYCLRQEARRALAAGEFQVARASADEAENLHSTGEGRRLQFISRLPAAG